MIQIQIRDTLVDIIEKIESQKSWDIILDFPLGHPILHNYVSLKVLKSKAKNRRFVIATSDKVWRKIGKSLGIEYSLVKNRSFLENGSQDELMQHNYSFFEYLKFQVRSYSWEFRSSIEANKKFNTLSKYSHIYAEKNSLHIFFIILICAIFLFTFVYYFAVSQTIVIITPERIIRTEAHNFIFKENIENNILWSNKYIKIDVLKQKIQSSETYASTDIQNTSQSRSQGKVRIYNAYPEVQDIIWGTRLQDTNGIVFELENGIQIPGAITDNFWNIIPGEIEILVQAKEKDNSWAYTWKRWDIWSGVTFILPALDKEAQKMLYAESIEDFSWGEDSFQKVVAPWDIENAQSLFKEKLKDVALKSIKNTITKINTENRSSFDILSGGKSITYGDPEIMIETWVSPWDVRENFKVSWSVTVTAYIYNKNDVVQKLKTLIGEKTLQWIEKIDQTDPNSLRMSQVIYLNEANENISEDPEGDQEFELKATFEIDSIFIHDFLDTQNSYIETLKSKIRGLPKKEAEKVLLNDPKVSNVEIQIRPFFITTVSNIWNNIIFKIR